jgi:hypothetical protein
VIEVRLFGGLQQYSPDPKSVPGTPLHLPLGDGSTLGQVLDRVGIDLEQVSNVFLNGRLLPRSVYPITLGYPLAADGPLSPEGYLSVSIKPGDRLGIFPRNMGSVVV